MQCLRVRRKLELGSSGREATARLPGGVFFQRGGQTCPAPLVQFGPESRSCASRRRPKTADRGKDGADHRDGRWNDAAGSDRIINWVSLMAECEKASSFYDSIRDQVGSEDTLHNQSVKWLISMQAFLFATLGLTLQAYLADGVNQSSPLLTGSLILIAVTGILVAMVSNRVISNGRVALNSLRNQWNAFAQNLSEEDQPLLRQVRA